MKKLIAVAAIAVALFSTAANAQAIRIGTEGAYEPWNYVNADGNLAGLDIDVMNELCKRTGLECTFVQTAWDTIIPNLNAGNYDVIAAGTSKGARVRALVQLTGIWMVGSKFGLTWKVQQLILSESSRLGREFAFQPTDEDNEATEPLGQDDDDMAKIVELCEKASEILGRVNRAREAATRRKPTLPMIEKFVADLAPDDRASLMDRLGAGNGGSVLS